ncbi:uncharacterized protein SPPG_04457 [Spizellomyces punctatus DAOM BR117]|uniref:Rotatin N-terminal domain-containing protein n=1 Tax=Spizellomyces punctatus (strain DAOM BR117) TaxID=645134 RepID=A0A0L0HGX2_SPIPD|nr:uncharacterized protein SPPG_04457 [Spizellomyces punctatus DAOM BR117]KND00115.1 hypothetical protein SPPG_04457 [Spizellomyces punctatus DAOM BR117]|eukprot:XP_016608154.1 hypothetical protein SPPG_04457 [Spizellomyces punctatus DAOM BR117]
MEYTVKLDHAIPEVRKRAFEHLKFKLRTGIVSVDEIAHERGALEKILKYIGIGNSEHEEIHTSLELLQDLCKNSTTRTNLVELGVRDVLERLRENIHESGSVALLDDIRERLRHLPGQVESPLIYQRAQYSGEYEKAVSSRQPSLGHYSPDRRPTTASPVNRRIGSPDHWEQGGAPHPLPYLPYAIPTYEVIQLTAADERIIDEFCTIHTMSGGWDRERGRELFDILLLDFGAGIFLQKSQLFRTILSNATADVTSPSCMYLEELLLQWQNHFRKCADVTSKHCTLTPSTVVPVSIGPSLFAEHGSSVTDYMISIPFACHEVFVTMIPLMRHLKWMPEVLRILYNALPFFKLHLSMASAQTSQHISHKVIVSYVQSVTAIVDYHGAMVERSHGETICAEYLYARERCALFAFDLLDALISLEEDWNFSELLWEVVELFSSMPNSNAVPGSLITYLLTKPSPLPNAILLYLLRHENSWVRLQAVERLKDAWNDTEQKSALFCSAPLVIALIETACESADGQTLQVVYPMLQKSILSCIDPSLIWSILPWLQLMYDADEGKLMKSAMNIAEHKGHEHDEISFWTRALLHKDKRLRQEAVSHLMACVPDLTAAAGNLEDCANTLLIPSSLLAIIQADRSSAAMVDKSASVERFCNSLESSLPSDGDLKDDLRDIADGIFVRATKQRAKDLGLHLRLLKLLNQSGASWLMHPGVLLRAFIILRVLVETDVGVRSDLIQDRTFVRTLARYIFHFEAQLRYELARIFSSLFFMDDQLCTNVHRVVASKFYLYMPSNATVDASGPERIAEDPAMVRTILDFLSSYRGNVRLSQSETHMLENWNNPFFWKIEQSASDLRQAQSHAAFEAAVLNLRTAFISENDCNLLWETDVPLTLQRILLLPPANVDDALLLTQLLHFLADILIYPGIFSHFEKVLLSSFEKVLLPILCSGSQDGTYHEADASVEYLGSSAFMSEILAFSRKILHDASDEDVMASISRTDALSSLYILGQRLLDAKGIASPRNCMNWLMILLRCVSLCGIMSAVSGEVMSGIISILVHTLRSCQQYPTQPANPHHSCHESRGLYRLAALCLRSISRTTFIEATGEVACAWGEHWMVEGSIDWMVVLLNDHEELLQKVGMGILSNLTMVDDARPLLENQLPHFLDVAFEHVMTVNTSPSIRKESVLLVKNYVVRSCHDMDGRFSSDTQQSNGFEDAVRKLGTARRDDVLAMFERYGFFARLKDVVDCDDILVRCAVSELLVSLSILSPALMRHALCEANALPFLLTYLEDKDIKECPPEEDTYALYEIFRRQLVQDADYEILNSTKCNVLRILWLVSFGSPEIQAYLVDETFVLKQLVRVLRDLWDHWKDGHLRQELLQIPTIALALHVLKELLFVSATRRPKELETTFKTEQNGLTICQLLVVSMRQTLSTSLARVACQTLARILSLHYSVTVDLGLADILDHEMRIFEGGNGPIGTVLFEQLVHVLFRRYELEDAAYMESVRICLQCLLGCCNSVKTHAVQGGFLSNLLERARLALDCTSRLDGPQEQEMFVIVTLLRHILAGSTEAKLSATKERTHVLLHHILSSKESSDVLAQEALHCLRNLIANCNNTKRVMFEQMRIKGRDASLTDILVSMVRKKTIELNTYNGCLDVLKILALHGESRAAMWKTNILVDLKNVLSWLTKVKDYPRVETLLSLYLNSTFAYDGQVNVMRTPELFDQLVQLLTVRSIHVKRTTVLILRNLAIAKENKAHFLLHGEVLSILCDLLGAKSLEILSPTTSLIRGLLCDSEKAKVALKKADVKRHLDSLNHRLHSVYSWYLKRSDGRPGTHDSKDDMSEQDEEYLEQTLSNLAIVNKLLLN